MKKHLYEIDFIRIICSLGIIVFHYSCHSSSSFKPYYKYINGSFGALTVIVFFIISGFCLYRNNKVIKSIKNFYIRRLKTLLPMFYLCWFIFYIINVINERNPFYGGNPITLVFTLIDMDGLVIERIATYHNVGEWFSGALLITYLLYPLMLKGLQKHDKCTLFILAILTIVWNMFELPQITNAGFAIVECCLEVYIGMLLCKYWEKLNNNYLFIGSLVYFILCLLIKFDFLRKIIVIGQGTAYFVVLYHLGKIVSKTDLGKNICNKIGKLTYPMFLLQHQIINYVLEVFNPTRPLPVITNITVCIVLTIVFSKLISVFTSYITNNKWFIQLGND